MTWAATWEKVSFDICAQRKLKLACVSAHLFRLFVVRKKKLYVSGEKSRRFYDKILATGCQRIYHKFYGPWITFAEITSYDGVSMGKIKIRCGSSHLYYVLRYLALPYSALPCVIIPVNTLQAPVKCKVNAPVASCQYFTVKSTGFLTCFQNAPS